MRSSQLPNANKNTRTIINAASGPAPRHDSPRTARKGPRRESRKSRAKGLLTRQWPPEYGRRGSPGREPILRCGVEYNRPHCAAADAHREIHYSPRLAIEANIGAARESTEDENRAATSSDRAERYGVENNGNRQWPAARCLIRATHARGHAGARERRRVTQPVKTSSVAKPTYCPKSASAHRAP